MARIEEYRSSNIFQGLSPLSKYLYSWPLYDITWRDYKDNDFIYEFARITHSLSLSANSVTTQDNVNDTVEVCKRVNDNKNDSELECVISIQISPWHYVWKNYDTFHGLTVEADKLQPEDRTTIYDATDNYTQYNDGTWTVYDAEIDFWVVSINDIKSKLVIANALHECNIRIGSIDLDCEKWDTFFFNTENNLAGITENLDTAQIRIMSTLDGITNPSDYISEIEDISLTWYLKGGHFANYTDLTDFLTYYTYPSRYYRTDTIQTIGCASPYSSHNPIGIDTELEAMEINALDTVGHPELYHDKIAVFFSLCAGYNPISPDGSEAYGYYSYVDNPVINSYKTGRKMAGENTISLPITNLHLWPPPLKPEYSIKENALEEWSPEFSWGYMPEEDYLQTGDTPFPEDPSGPAMTDWIDHWIEFVKGFNDVDSGVVIIYNGDTIEASDSDSYRFYVESDDDEATINIDGAGYTIGSASSSQFVWDSDGDSYTFTYEGESILRDLGSRTAVITYNGEGSYLFDINTLTGYARFYKIVADLINDAQARGSDIASFVDKMATDLDSSEIPSIDIHREKLDDQISSTLDSLTLNNVNYTTQMLKFVGDLQRYTTSKYGSVDTFLGNNSIKVKSTFADISEEVGYPILPGNISDVS